MPLAFSKKFTGPVALPLDNSNYVAGQPYCRPAPTDQQFEVHFISELEVAEMEAAFARKQGETYGDWRDRVVAALKKHIVAAHNMGNVAVDEVLKSLADGELNDLASQILCHSKLGYEEAKKSKLPPLSGQAVSAGNAGAASAATNPTMGNPSTAPSA